MKIYKYRSFHDPSVSREVLFERLEVMLLDGVVWCSALKDLDDPEEFIVAWDSKPTSHTAELLAQYFVVNSPNWSSYDQAFEGVSNYLSEPRLKEKCDPIAAAMTRDLRHNKGLACFGQTDTNARLWADYANSGNGICVEFDVPDSLLGDSLFPVDYLPENNLHIDDLIAASLEGAEHRSAIEKCHRAILLLKNVTWRDQAEVRFITKAHSVQMRINDSRITKVKIGLAANREDAQFVERICAGLEHPPCIEYQGRNPE